MKTQFPLILVSLVLAMPPLVARGQTDPSAQGQRPDTPSQKQAALDKESTRLSKIISQQQTYPSMKMAQDVLKQNSNDAEAHRTLAEHYGIQRGQFADEMRERREAVRCNPDNPYDIVALASMERFVHHEESLRLLASVANGDYDDQVKQDAKGLLGYIKTHTKPARL